MKQLLPIAAFVLTLTLVFTACDDKDYTAVAPTFGEITLTPSTCAPGDSVTVKVKVATEGQYYYYSYQDYTIGKSKYRLGSTSYNKSNTSNGSISAITGDAEFKIKAPEKADTTYTVTFKATAASTADAFKTGSLYATTNTVSTTLTIGSVQ